MAMGYANEVGLQAKPASPFDRIGDVAEQLSHLEDRVARVASILVGPIPQDGSTRAGPAPVPDGALGALSDTADTMSGRIARMSDALNRIEGRLP